MSLFSSPDHNERLKLHVPRGNRCQTLPPNQRRGDLDGRCPAPNSAASPGSPSTMRARPLPPQTHHRSGPVEPDQPRDSMDQLFPPPQHFLLQSAPVLRPGTLHARRMVLCSLRQRARQPALEDSPVEVQRSADQTRLRSLRPSPGSRLHQLHVDVRPSLRQLHRSAGIRRSLLFLHYLHGARCGVLDAAFLRHSRLCCLDWSRRRCD